MIDRAELGKLLQESAVRAEDEAMRDYALLGPECFDDSKDKARQLGIFGLREALAQGGDNDNISSDLLIVE